MLTSEISPPLSRYCNVTSCSFYNLVTDFYEYGWGQSFHFAPRRKNEYFRESIRRAEYVLASRIEVTGVFWRALVEAGVDCRGFSDSREIH